MREVSTQAFASARADGAVTIDVREPAEYLSGHVPGVRQGFDASSVAGGVAGWESAGYPVIRGAHADVA